MMAYYFRAMNEDGPTGWVGFVMCRTKKELFWGIDEFIDPYSVQIKKAHGAGYCRLLVEDEDAIKYEASGDEYFVTSDEEGWITPNWNRVIK
tara:strand:+ start:2298 stop:2573 length:276 start_codon:yes stop_codon:yes gene_type:complete